MVDISVRQGSRSSIGSIPGLAAYLPWDRRRALASSQDLADRTSGAALFADISGFTALTEELTQRLGAQRGADELASLVNRALSDVITEVHRFGGSVIGFAGDAVTAWFDGDDGRRAVAAALATQGRRLGAGDGDAGDLAVKLGATSGLARRFLVGHPRIQRIDVVAGAILDRMAMAEELGKPGEVLVGSEIVGWVRDRIQILEWRQATEATPDGRDHGGREGEWFAVIAGDPQDLAEPMEEEPDATLPAEVVRDWVIPAVYQRLIRGRGEILPEIRSAVPLFCRFSGIAYDLDNQAEPKLDQYIRWVQTVLAKYEAFLLDLVVGDKGSYFYAAFGVPLAHEDDRIRAVRAAVDIVATPPELDFIASSSVGISHGKVLAGAHGSPMARTYGALGQAANRAARLMQAAAPGEVLVDEAVAEAASGRFVFAPAAPGVSRVVEARITSPILEQRRRRSVPTIGRAAETERLEEALQRLLDGERQMVVLEGAAGIGKSRLLAELKAEAESMGIPVYVGAGNAVERNTPFFAWRAVFGDMFGLGEGMGPDEVLAAVERHLADEPDLMDMVPLLDPVLPVDLPENTVTSQMSPAVRSSNALDVMVACLRHPVAALAVAVVVLDDGQWLDSASWALVERAQAGVPGLFLAVSTRPPEPGDGDSQETTAAAISRLIESAPERMMEVASLTPAEVGELAAGYLGVMELPARLLTVLIERAEGNPFFVEALLDTLLERGLIEVVKGRCELLGTMEQLRAELPEDVERLLISRLDHLTLPQQMVLLAASIIGRRFTAAMLREVAPSEMALQEVDDQLESLVELDVLTVGDETGERTFEFRHGLVRQAAADLLPPSLKRVIHERTGRWIEEQYPQALVPWYSVLAHHWDAAGDVDKALHYLDLAAGHAFATSAYDESVHLYRRATELAEETGAGADRLARWHLRLGEVYVHRQEEDVTRGRHHLERGLRILGRAPPVNPVVQVLALLGRAVTHLWRRMGRRRIVADPERAEQLLEASRAYERLVEVYFISGETVLSLYAALRALDLAERVGPSPELARGLATVGAILGFVPLRSVAERYLSRSLAMADPDVDAAAAAWTALVAAFYQAGVGDWGGRNGLPGAEQLARRVIDLSSAVGDGRRLEDGLANLMFQQYLRGQLAEGLHQSERLLAMADLRVATRPRAYGLQGLCYCLLDAGRVPEAREAVVELDDLLAADARFADQALIDDVTGLLATVEARAGRLPRASQYAESLLNRVARQRPSNYSSLAAHSASVEVFLTEWVVKGRSRDLERKVRRSLRVLERYARVFPIGRPRLLLWRGIEAGVRGRPGRAVRLLRAGAEAASAIGLPLDEHRALIALADQLGPTSEEGLAVRRQAEEVAAGSGLAEVGAAHLRVGQEVLG